MEPAPEQALALRSLFGGTYAGRRVLVTGHTGFKGSWLALWLQAMGAQVCGLSLAPAGTPNHFALLNLALPERLVDIREADAVRSTVQEFKPEVVFHLAAQALVRESYADPVATFDVNVMGLVNVLEAVNSTLSVRAVVSVTSDKCYRQRNSSTPFVETDALGGFDPYSASKACAEIVSESYRASFLASRLGQPVALMTARAGNVVGGGDWSNDRLIPDLARGASEGRVVCIRSPHAVRPWQHVLEPLSGYLLLGQRLLGADFAESSAGSAWNFGPDSTDHLTVAQVIDGFSRHWNGVRAERITCTQLHEANYLRLNCDRARAELNWHPVWSAETMMQRTADWYRAWYASGEVRTRHDLYDYVRDARTAGLSWAA